MNEAVYHYRIEPYHEGYAIERCYTDDPADRLNAWTSVATFQDRASAERELAAFLREEVIDQ